MQGGNLVVCRWDIDGGDTRTRFADMDFRQRLKTGLSHTGYAPVKETFRTGNPQVRLTIAPKSRFTAD